MRKNRMEERCGEMKTVWRTSRQQASSEMILSLTGLGCAVNHPRVHATRCPSSTFSPSTWVGERDSVTCVGSAGRRENFHSTWSYTWIFVAPHWRVWGKHSTLTSTFFFGSQDLSSVPLSQHSLALMPDYQLPASIALVVAAATSATVNLAASKQEGKIKLQGPEGEQEHDPFNVTTPEDVAPGEPIDGPQFWSRVWFHLRSSEM